MKRRQSHKVIEVGISDKDLCEGDPEIMPGWKIPIAKYFATLGMTAKCVYDYGNIFFSTQAALDAKITEILRVVDEIQTHARPVIEAITGL